MKKYDRETKKWLTEEEYQALKKKRRLCKGGKPHNFVLVLPDYVKCNKNNQPEKYYKIEDQTIDFLTRQNEKLKKLGFEVSSYQRKEARYYNCSVCDKIKYETLW